MKKTWKTAIAILIFSVWVILSGIQIVRVNDRYGLTVTKEKMGENVAFRGYDVQVNQAEIYTLNTYYAEYPEVEYFREQSEDLYKYAFVATLQITKTDDSTQPLDLTDFVFRMGNSFNQFNPAEMTKLNGWTETQYLEVGEPFYLKIPYYISERYFNKKQLEDIEEVEYRITLGVYPERYELCLDRIEGWKNVFDGDGETETEEITEANKNTENDIVENDRTLTGAEGYAALLKENGLTASNLHAPGETANVKGVTYDVRSVKQIYNVSEIPDYSEEYQPQPEWMKEGADVPGYTEEWDYRGDFVRKHNYLLAELQVTNETEEEAAPRMISTGIAFEPSYRDDIELKSSSENEYSTGGAVEYKDSYSDFIVLQPQETKTVYVLYDLFFDIDPTGTNDVLESGEPTGFLSEEEAETALSDSLPLYFFIDAGLGGEMKFKNKGITFIELDWRAEDGTEN